MSPEGGLTAPSLLGTAVFLLLSPSQSLPQETTTDGSGLGYLESTAPPPLRRLEFIHGEHTHRWEHEELAEPHGEVLKESRPRAVAERSLGFLF